MSHRRVGVIGQLDERGRGGENTTKTTKTKKGQNRGSGAELGVLAGTPGLLAPVPSILVRQMPLRARLDLSSRDVCNYRKYKILQEIHNITRNT